MAKFICFLKGRLFLELLIKRELVHVRVDREEGERDFVDVLDQAFYLQARTELLAVEVQSVVGEDAL